MWPSFSNNNFVFIVSPHECLAFKSHFQIISIGIECAKQIEWDFLWHITSDQNHFNFNCFHCSSGSLLFPLWLFFSFSSFFIFYRRPNPNYNEHWSGSLFLYLFENFTMSRGWLFAMTAFVCIMIRVIATQKKEKRLPSHSWLLFINIVNFSRFFSIRKQWLRKK